MRQWDYYWVHYPGCLLYKPAYWDGSYWYLTGDNMGYFDDEFDSIGPKLEDGAFDRRGPKLEDMENTTI